MCAYVFASLSLFKGFGILYLHSEKIKEHPIMETTIIESHGKSPYTSPTCSGHLLLHKLDKSLALLKANQSRL